MTVLKSVLRPVLKDILRPILFSDVVTRFFTTLIASGSMHYTIPTVTLTGDYENSVLVYFTGNIIRVYGDDLTFNSRLSCQDDGRVIFGASNTESSSLIAVAGSLPLNKLSIIKAGRVGSDGFIKINGVTVQSGTVGTGNAIVNRIGKQSTSFSSGIIADMAFDTQRFYAIDEDLATTTTIVDSISGQNGTAVSISSSDFYQLNDAGTIWLNQSGGSDLDIA